MSDKYTITNNGPRIKLGGFLFQGASDPSGGVNILSKYELQAVCRKLPGVDTVDDLQALFNAADDSDQPVKGDARPVWTDADLVQLSFEELRELADKHGIKGRSKADLINSLEGKDK